MCLRFVYVLAVRIVAALRLWWRGDDHKTIEILLLRHQLAVLQRQLAATGKRPRPDWADRAIIALLVGLVPKARRAGLRLIVTPDTILRWHRDLLRRRWAKKSRPKNGRPATHRNIKIPGSAPGPPESGLGLPADPRRAGRPRHRRRRLHRLGDPQERRRRPGAPTRLGHLGELPAVPGRRDHRLPTSSPPTSWTARRSTSWPSSSMPPAGSASSAARFIRPASGPRRWPATWSWTSTTPLPR